MTLARYVPAVALALGLGALLWALARPGTGAATLGAFAGGIALGWLAAKIQLVPPRRTPDVLPGEIAALAEYNTARRNGVQYDQYTEDFFADLQARLNRQMEDRPR